MFYFIKTGQCNVRILVKKLHCSYFLSFLSVGFYDTSEEVVNALDPNFKRLRQDHMDEKRRDDVEEVTKSSKY